jgi:hypothetical protein
MDTRRAPCHRGGVVFEVDLANGFEKLRLCVRSIRRKGAVTATVPLERATNHHGRGQAEPLPAEHTHGEALLL